MAANTRGIALVQDLIGEYGLGVVQAYMRHIQANAEGAVREMLIAFSQMQGLAEVSGWLAGWLFWVYFLSTEALGSGRPVSGSSPLVPSPAGSGCGAGRSPGTHI